MHSKTIYAVLAFLFSIAIYAPYVQLVLQRKIRPTISTWLSWELMDAAIFAGMLTKGEISWQIVAYMIGGIFVIGTCIYRKNPLGWSNLDNICLILVLTAITLWWHSGEPNVVVVVSCVAITAGTIPMIVNIWREPEREHLFPWILALIGGIFGVLAASEWTISAALAPLWFLILQIIMLILMARRFLKNN